MKKQIKNQEFNSANYKTFNRFLLDLSYHNIDYTKLKGDDLANFNLIMDDIRCYMISNLRQFNMNWKDFKDYASEWFSEYKENDNKDSQKYVIIWKEE